MVTQTKATQIEMTMCHDSKKHFVISLGILTHHDKSNQTEVVL